MKKVIVYCVTGIALVIGFASCKKNNPEQYDYAAQLRLDSIAIKEYVTKNNIKATMQPDAKIWYEIINPGEPNSYEYKVIDTLGSKGIWNTAKLKYSGKLLDGTVFDATKEGQTTYLSVVSRLSGDYPFDSSLIPAWIFAFFPEKIDNLNLGGLTKTGLQKGAKIRIITPSFWAYQNRSDIAKIPANSPLDFTIEVVDITTYDRTKVNQ